MTSIDATRLDARETRSSAAPPMSRTPWYAKYRLLLLCTDALMVALALTLTYLFRFGDEAGAQVSGSTFPYLAVGILIGILWLLHLEAVESRSSKVYGTGLDEYQRVLKASLYTFGAVAVGSYLAQAQISRIFFITSLPVGAALLLVGRWLSRHYLNSARGSGRALTPTLIIGDEEQVLAAVREMRRHPEAGYVPRMVCLVEPGRKPIHTGLEELQGLTRIDLARLDDFASLPRSGAVAVAGGLSPQALKRLAWGLENRPVELMLVPQLVDVAGPRISVRSAEGLGLLQVDLPTYSGWNHVLKRAFDVVFSAVALILISPVLAVVALAIKFDDGGPVIFRQQRIGLRGEPFTIHKFRTMRVNAEAQIARMIAEAGGQALLFKVENDPRVTRIGHLLRKYSLDELPQFWTVLQGRMSVVGPRPQVAREVAEYADHHHRRLLTKPGITGLWQVSGRSDLSLEDSIRLDLNYVENWSLAGDVAIVLRTIKVVLLPRGAY